MPRKAHNSEWERRLCGYLTDRGLLQESLEDERVFRDYMLNYKRPVTGYVKWLLLRHQTVVNESEADAGVTAIWYDLIHILPIALMRRWKQGGIRFRDLLREGVHEAHYSWHKRSQYKPALGGLLTPKSEDDEAWYRESRRELLAIALEKLKKYQREQESHGNLYYLVFTLWDAHRNEPYINLQERLAATAGGRKLSATNFRKALNRAQDKFGGYLFEEVAAWIVERGTVSPECYRQAFEELDFMESYALHSKTCRFLLGVDDEG